ncbi:S8 family peptidase [Bacillus infantis]|uniref:S8 family peptidase n=1 Tax=Bacillus infantis TaxID=324767 RepID=UPI002FBE8FB6
MKKIKKQAISLAAGLVLAAGPFASVNSAYAGADLNLKTGVAAYKAESPLLQKKLEQTKQAALSEDTILIKYSKPLTATEHRAAGGTLVKIIPGLNYAVVKVKDKKNLNKAMNKYSSFKQVESVNPSALYKPLAITDPKVNEQYHLGQLKAAEAQKLAGNKQVTVAVIDQGTDMNHPELKGKLLPGYNTVNPMNQGSPDYHGTHVSGIIAGAKDNGIGGYGINPNAKILPIDVFDRGWGASDFAIAQGILHAVEKGAKVINMSLGGPMKSPVIEEAVNKALEKNVTVVAAAGNTGDDTLSYPAAYEGVISVGSVNSKKNLSDFSTFGPSVDVVAPGDEVYSTLYDYEKKSTFTKMSGTSMASPMVAGTVSLLLSKYPDLTPSQVEYVLEHTADDLGDKGFDVKYGNGLINPVRALQYDMKKIPDLSSKAWSEKEILEKAEKVELNGNTAFTGTFTKPFEEKWLQMDVRIGDKIQFELDGASQYDYKLMIYLNSPEGKLKLDVNKVREGKKEGKFIDIPHSGTLSFGVKDVNGSYDDSGKRLSNYNLNVKKLKELPKDESSSEMPIDIQLPYDSKGKDYTLMAAGQEKDDDFYSFSVEEEQLVRISLSAIPGVDTSIGVYEIGKDMIDLEGMSKEEQESLKKEIAKSQEEGEPVYYSNNKGKSEGETLSFIARPDMEYKVKASNEAVNYFGIYDFIMNEEMMDEEQKPEFSLTPYNIKVEGKVLPPDEDGLPMLPPEGEDMGGTLESQREVIFEEYSPDEEFDYVQTIKDGALPSGIGQAVTGYLQSMEDEDWYSITPEETGIYEFNFDDKSNLPLVEIYQIKTDKDKEGKEHSYLSWIGTNMDYSWYPGKLEGKLYTGMEKGETYYLKAATDYMAGSVSFDPYQFNSKLLVSNTGDKYENNNELENIKDLPSAAFEANFSMPNDQDIFYFEPKKTDIYAMTMEMKTASEALKAKYPKQLFGSYFGYMAVIEDVNKDRKLDDEEYARSQYLEKGSMNGTTYGSFKAEKGKSYIILASAYFEGVLPLSLNPYKLTLAPVNKADEDKGSVVKGNIPSKPLPLKKKSDKAWEAAGYLNAGVPYGDEDWYELKLDKDASGTLEFVTGMEADGVISLYRNGKLLAAADHYAAGDTEVMAFNLKKGTYHIKVRDTFGNATLTPYNLKVNIK